MPKHCCDSMDQQIGHTCAVHDDPFDCPNHLIEYCAKFDEYGIIVHDGGRSIIRIDYCPWCGSRLPESKRSRWFEELGKLGFDTPGKQSIPEEFKTDAWYRN